MSRRSTGCASEPRDRAERRTNANAEHTDGDLGLVAELDSNCLVSREAARFEGRGWAGDARGQLRCRTNQ